MLPDWLAAVLVALTIALLFAFTVSIWLKKLTRAKRSRSRTPQRPPSRELEFSSTLHVAERAEPQPGGERYRRWTSLTLRERVVAELASEGKSSEEIARELSITTRTVSKHLEHIFKKLNIKSRSEIKYIRLYIASLEQDPPQKSDT